MYSEFLKNAKIGVQQSSIKWWSPIVIGGAALRWWFVAAPRSCFFCVVVLVPPRLIWVPLLSFFPDVYAPPPPSFVLWCFLLHLFVGWWFVCVSPCFSSVLFLFIFLFVVCFFPAGCCVFGVTAPGSFTISPDLVFSVNASREGLIETLCLFHPKNDIGVDMALDEN